MKIFDKKTIVTICLSFVVMIALFGINSKSYALELNTPQIVNFIPQSGEDGALRINFNNTNSNENFSYEIVNTTTGKINIISGSSKFFVLQNLEYGKSYTISVRACLNEKYNCSLYTKQVTAKTSGVSDSSLSTPVLSSVVAKSATSIQLNYQTSGVITGVEVFNITTGKSTKTTNKTTYTSTGRNPSTTYSYKIRTYYTINGKTTYSAYSDVKSAKTKAKTGVSRSEFISIADAQGAYLDKHNFRYCGKCGTPDTWSEVKKAKGSKKRTNCALYVSIVMQEAKLIPKGKAFYVTKGKIKGDRKYIVNNSKIKVTYVNKTVASLVKSGKLGPGDIVGGKTGTHTMIYKKKGKNGNYIFDSAGPKGINGSVKNCSYKGSYKVGVIIHPKSFDD